MCDDHGHISSEAAQRPSESLSRRALLKAAALSSAAVAALSRASSSSPAAAATIEGAYSMAMHIHASFSERFGSMNAQLSEASKHNVDVLWWTEHDTKMNGKSDKDVVHFTSLTGETGDGTPWQWRVKTLGSHTSASSGGIVGSPSSPHDSVAAGSLRVAAQSTGMPKATYGFTPADLPSHQTWRTNLTGQAVSIEMRPTSIGRDAFLEVLLVSSYHPASGGRAAGRYVLSYRVGGAAAPGTRRASARLGIITRAASPDAACWTSLVLRPQQDLAALFPDLDSRDFSLYGLELNAVSASGEMASGTFDYLRFTRPTTGEVALSTQHSMMMAYTDKYPTVAQRHGLEVSHYLPHINWFGGAISLPPYVGATKPGWKDHLRTTVIPEIHRRGGLASYNHPYGTGFGPLLPRSTQDQLRRELSTEMLANKACGADIIEVGYPRRAGVDLAHHLGLWDVLSRNALFLTGNGVSDDHLGVDWLNPPNVTTWTTSAWAPSRTEGDLLAALRAGQAWCGSMAGFQGALDLSVGGGCPMGSVSVSSLPRRDLRLTATSVPTGGSVQAIQGIVDYAGAAAPVPGTKVIATVPARDLVAGSLSLAVDTAQSSFVRTQVLNSAGTVVALSNPVWLLRDSPRGGIPAARAC